MLMGFAGAVSQHLCSDPGDGDSLALHRLDNQWVLESQRTHYRGTSLLTPAAVSHSAGTIYSYLPIV